MQVATLSYQYNPKDQFSTHSKSKHPSRHVLTTVINPATKKPRKQDNLTTKYNQPLPPIKSTTKTKNSISIHGNGLQGAALQDSSLPSFHQASRSHSRHSNRSDPLGGRSQTMTPVGGSRRPSRFVHLKFGYPVKTRSKDFYKSDFTESELQSREHSFVNDSVRTSTENIHHTKATHYDPLNDPNLSDFFQSPTVLKVVRKSLNIDEFDPRLAELRRQSKSREADPNIRKIVAKHSSGYGQLNGYDCIPPFASTRLRRLLDHDRYQTSAKSSLKSIPTSSSTYSQSNRPSKRLTALTRSSPMRHPTAVTHNTDPISTIS